MQQFEQKKAEPFLPTPASLCHFKPEHPLWSPYPSAPVGGGNSKMTLFCFKLTFLFFSFLFFAQICCFVLFFFLKDILIAMSCDVCDNRVIFQLKTCPHPRLLRRQLEQRVDPVTQDTTAENQHFSIGNTRRAPGVSQLERKKNVQRCQWPRGWVTGLLPPLCVFLYLPAVKEVKTRAVRSP